MNPRIPARERNFACYLRRESPGGGSEIQNGEANIRREQISPRDQSFVLEGNASEKIGIDDVCGKQRVGRFGLVTKMQIIRYEPKSENGKQCSE